ncbi:RING-type domain-containing protein [Caenorhabditis elegans]|uniref:RING-type domain-containing protein n=1 Tax=Caenorhabditis elegans TaxID=6239 RepID=C3JXE5_CAEEL|nr:RING-type domain-containing protein [Caenorhabditis elegans]CCD70944.1 RING-type domain-containing protein [Caenorhabditis elegans]|eukprot:NP_497167.2 Uncharacterized protein CELE_F40G9.12 [Caenorhabditis elegans]
MYCECRNNIFQRTRRRTQEMYIDDGRPECKICYKNYETSGDHCPRVLSCGHTYCEICIQELASLRNNVVIACPYCTKLSIISFKHWILTSFRVSSAFPTNFLVLEILNGKAKDMLQCGVCQLTYSSQRIPRIHPSCGKSVCEDCKEHECKACEPPNEQSLYRLVMARLAGNVNWKSDVPINYTIRDFLEE